jgi:RNA polymerase sigma factor (sigma-70 family)
MEAGALHAPAGLSRISIGSPLLRLRSDDQLVAAFRAGNEDAFQVIFDRYRQRLFAYTRQMLAGSRQDAEDALQDVFLRAYGALRANDRPVSLRAWLYRVAHNRCIDQLRRPAPAQADVFDLSRTPLRDPIEESARREDLRRLVEDVQRLPEAQRSALLMREMDGLSYQELADALEVTVPAVKSLLVRARIGLVEAIEARDTACAEIRTDLMASYDKGVRASGKARRHLRDCAGCRQYRTDLRTVQRGFGALAPSHGPLSALLKLFGLGSGAGGAAAGSGAVLGGGSAAVVGGSAATATACKVAVVVCSAALVTGAAGDIEHAVKRAVAPVVSSSHTASAASKSAAVSPVHVAAAPHMILARSPLEKLIAAPASTKAAAAVSPAAAAHAAQVRRLRAKAEPSAAVADAEAHAQAITPDDEVYASANAEDPVTQPQQDMNVTGGAVAPPVAPDETAPGAPSAPAPGAGTTTGTATPAATPGTSATSGTSATPAPGATPSTPPASGTTATGTATAPTPPATTASNGAAPATAPAPTATASMAPTSGATPAAPTTGTVAP